MPFFIPLWASGGDAAKVRMTLPPLFYTRPKLQGGLDEVHILDERWAADPPLLRRSHWPRVSVRPWRLPPWVVRAKEGMYLGILEKYARQMREPSGVEEPEEESLRRGI